MMVSPCARASSTAASSAAQWNWPGPSCSIAFQSTSSEIQCTPRVDIASRSAARPAGDSSMRSGSAEIPARDRDISRGGRVERQTRRGETVVGVDDAQRVGRRRRGRRHGDGDREAGRAHGRRRTDRRTRHGGRHGETRNEAGAGDPTDVVRDRTGRGDRPATVGAGARYAGRKTWTPSSEPAYREPPRTTGDDQGPPPGGLVQSGSHARGWDAQFTVPDASYARNRVVPPVYTTPFATVGAPVSARRARQRRRGSPPRRADPGLTTAPDGAGRVEGVHRAVDQHVDGPAGDGGRLGRRPASR